MNYIVDMFQNLNQYEQGIVRDAVLDISEKYKNYIKTASNYNEVETIYKDVVNKCFMEVDKELKKLNLPKEKYSESVELVKRIISAMFVRYEESETKFDIKVRYRPQEERKPFSSASAKKLKITMKKVANNQFGYDIEYSSEDGSVHYITDSNGKVISTVGNVDIDFNKNLAQILYSKGFNIEYFHGKEKEMEKRKIENKYTCKFSNSDNVKEFVEYLTKEQQIYV